MKNVVESAYANIYLTHLPLRMVWNQGGALSPFLYNFDLEYASRRVQANQ